MKKVYAAVLIISAFLCTSAQVTQKNSSTIFPNAAPPSLLAGNAEFTPCVEMARVAAEPIDKSRFKNMAAFNSSGSFSVPAGTTEVLIEMWGAGGGGHFPGGGGGSGGYWTGLIPVTGISTITLTVGTGGTAGTHTIAAGNGGNTSFSCTGFNVSTAGGLGADSSLSAAFENYRSGRGGTGMATGATLPFGFNAFFAIAGQSGTPTQIDFIQVNGTSFTRRLVGGVGGIAPFSGQPDNPITSNLTSPGGGQRGITSTISTFVASSFGSGGTCLSSGATAGGAGRVVIYF